MACLLNIYHVYLDFQLNHISLQPAIFARSKYYGKQPKSINKQPTLIKVHYQNQHKCHIFNKKKFGIKGFQSQEIIFNQIFQKPSPHTQSTCLWFKQFYDQQILTGFIIIFGGNLLFNLFILHRIRLVGKF